MMKNRIHSGVGLLMATLLAACGGASPEPPSLSQAAPPYDFANPDTVFALPSALREISGLTMLDEARLAAVEDESGTLYIIDAATGAVAERRRFGASGDYEGVERVGQRFYILRSDGTLFQLVDGMEEAPPLRTPLNTGCDAEGLAYLPGPDRLIVACKKFTGKRPLHKALFAYDLSTGVMAPTPAFTIPVGPVGAALDAVQTDARTQFSGRIRRLVAPFTDLSGFTPSAMALHPQTNDVYVLSSSRKAVVVLSSDGALKAVWPLPGDLLEQPEGLTFHPNGTLFISTEGRGRPGRIFRFDHHQEGRPSSVR